MGLHFDSLLMVDFGPYKGENLVDFTKEAGVSILWGDNGRGKTTLLNAFRFCLFGSVQRRQGELKMLCEMENYEAREEGRFGFSVSIKMSDGDDEYELTRSYRLKDGVSHPSNGAADYEVDVYLSRNGSVLGPEDRDHVLNTLMPEQVSRFFLFDGELLKEYEELVVDASESGDQIKESIERILGMPVLENGVADLDAVLSDYKKAVSNAAKSNKQMQEISLRIDMGEEKISELNASISEYDAKRKALVSEKRDVDEAVKQTEQIRQTMSDLDAKRSELEKCRKRIDSYVAKAKAVMKTAWRGMLRARLQASVEESEEMVEGLERKRSTGRAVSKFIDDMEAACRDRRCPVCEQDVDGDTLLRLMDKVRKSKDSYSGLSPEQEDMLAEAQSRLVGLKRLLESDQSAMVAEYEQQIENGKIDESDLLRQIKALEISLRSYGKGNEEMSDIMTLVARSGSLAKKITNLQDAIEKDKAERDKTASTVSDLRKKMQRMSEGSRMELILKREKACEDLHSIFKDAVDVYSHRLKEHVERDATEFFVGIASDKGYTNLKINDKYGLEIVLADGRIVPGRSAGYEHVVAMSLIGALHKNAPLQGPIVMDSPFGRLDASHKRNAVGVLPSMAEQVILLAYTDEIDCDVARSSLGRALVSERRLERVTSLHTRIQ